MHRELWIIRIVNYGPPEIYQKYKLKYYIIFI